MVLTRSATAAVNNDAFWGQVVVGDALDLLPIKHKYAELEYAERFEKLELNRAERLKMQVDLYQKLSPGGVIDERAQFIFRDSVLNS